MECLDEALTMKMLVCLQKPDVSSCNQKSGSTYDVDDRLVAGKTDLPTTTLLVYFCTD